MSSSVVNPRPPEPSSMRLGRRRADPHGRAAGDEGGFALLAVMLVLALLGVVGAEFAYSMRLEASMVRALKESVAARHLAEAGVHQAIREVLAPSRIQALDEQGRLVFYRLAAGETVPTRLPALPREGVRLGPGEFSYRVSDEQGRLNLNAAPPDRVERLLAALGLDKRERDIINDALQDWKDANEEHRLNGAESEDTYLRLPVPYRARNGALQDAAELLQLRGMTRAIYRGEGTRPGLVDLVTVHGQNLVNINTASPLVLAALGLAEAEISDIVQSRARAPYAFVPGRFAGRSLGIGSATFRIEAEGVVAGEPRARLVVIVRRGGLPGARPPGGTGDGTVPVQILSWRAGDR